MALKSLFKKLRLKNENGERGVALILVLSLIVVVISVVSEIIFQSEITARVSVGERDRVRAEMAALTGAQLAKMLVLLDTAIAALPKEAKALLGSQLGDLKFNSMLDGIPVGGEAFENAAALLGEKASVFSAIDETLMTTLKNVPGYFTIKTGDESGKLNVNALNMPAFREAMKESLIRLFSTPREARFLEDKRYPPPRLVANLMDYIDRNKTDELDGSDEENQYVQNKFSHKPKNGPLESLEELRRIPGFHDDEIFSLFSPYLTVWPLAPEEKSLNVNAAPVELLAAITTKEGNDVNDQGIDKLEDFKADKKQVSAVQDLTSFFEETMSTGATSSLQKRISGVESTVFRIEVTGVSNGIERTYVLIMDRSKNKNIKDGPPVRIVHQRFL